MSSKTVAVPPRCLYAALCSTGQVTVGLFDRDLISIVNRQLQTVK